VSVNAIVLFPNMSAPAAFYVTGGTLRHDAPSYVERRADQELYDGLPKGDFCYVPPVVRQMKTHREMEGPAPSDPRIQRRDETRPDR
jgi:hypothetical protein